MCVNPTMPFEYPERIGRADTRVFEHVSPAASTAYFDQERALLLKPVDKLSERSLGCLSEGQIIDHLQVRSGSAGRHRVFNPTGFTGKSIIEDLPTDLNVEYLPPG